MGGFLTLLHWKVSLKCLSSSMVSLGDPAKVKCLQMRNSTDDIRSVVGVSLDIVAMERKGFQFGEFP